MNHGFTLQRRQYLTQLEVIKASVHRRQRISKVLHTADIHKAGQLTDGVGKAGFLHPLNHLVGLDLLLFKLRRNLGLFCAFLFGCYFSTHKRGHACAEHFVGNVDDI